LVQAQVRTEQRMEELVQAQVRIEQRMEELVQAQARTEQRMEELVQAQARTEQRMEELAQAQARLEQRMDRLGVAMAELAQAQARTEERLGRLEIALAALTQAQQRTEETLRTLAIRQDRMLGHLVEWRYARRATSYFGRQLRRIRVPLSDILDPALEEVLEARLTPEELHDVLQLDLIVSGRLRQAPRPEDAEVWLAVEASAMLDGDDVDRAQRRAGLLRKAGYRAIPVVAGDGVNPEASDRLEKLPVVLVLNGRSQGWEQALAAM
jgi:hypothetical protein